MLGSSGLSSVVNGTSFKDGLKSSLVHDVVALGLADAQTKIGGIFSDAQGNPVNGGEGSFGHVALHAIAGCVAAQAQGADCAAGAAGGAVQAIYAGVLNKGTTLSLAQQRQRAQLYGALAGFLFSGGKGENVSVASNIALSGMINNRQLHQNEADWIRGNAGAFATWMCKTHGECNLTRSQAIGILAAETLSGVSDGFDIHRVAFGDQARAFLDSHYAGPTIVDGQTMFGVLARGSQEYRDSLINADTAFTEIAIYELASQQSRWPTGVSATLAIYHEIFATYAENPNRPKAQALVDALAANPKRAALIFKAYGGSALPSNNPSLASGIGARAIINALPQNIQNQVALGYAQGLTGQENLTAVQIEAAVLNGTWGGVLDAAVAGLVLGDLAQKGFSIVTLSNGLRALKGANGNLYSSTKAARDGGVSNLTSRGTLKNLEPNDPVRLLTTPRTLVRDSNGRYWLEGANGTRFTPSGEYDFVTLPNGTIRVARNNNITVAGTPYSTHLGLSGGGEVNYAGTIRFRNSSGASRGNIVSWSNNSGHYQPPASLSNNSRLPSNLFKPNY